MGNTLSSSIQDYCTFFKLLFLLRQFHYVAGSWLAGDICVDQAAFRLSDLPASAFLVLQSKADTIIPGLYTAFLIFISVIYLRLLSLGY